jgi:serine/threonine-protein kinase
MIHAVFLDAPDLFRRFREEARCAAALRHPNIVRVYEAGEVGGRPYFAMEYVAGPSLADVLRTGPLEPRRAAQYVATVARAVAYLHERQIIHRDLKPSNILLDEQGRPCVTDFGLVKLVGQNTHHTSTGAVVGTPSHMAPEAAAGRVDRIGPASDVYGLGAILYHLLTGRPPFEAPTQIETLVRVLEGEPPAPSQLRPDVPSEVEAVCLRCLEKEPERRYPNALAVAEDLERFLRGEAVETGRAGPIRALERWSRREPALAARLGAAWICAVLSAAYHFRAHDLSPARLGAILVTLAIWALVAVGFQALVNRGRSLDAVRTAWLAADIGLLTAVLLFARAFGGPLVVAYPVLIAGSGLWFRVRLVAATTGLAILAYGSLMLATAFGPGGLEHAHWHTIVLFALGIIGLIVAYQVRRVHTLSRYYENRPGGE